MATMNIKPNAPRTHEGAVAKHITKEQELRRSVMSCLLWEDSFYEAGESIAERIKKLVPQVDALKVADIAAEARHQMNLRHVPLLLCRELARIGKLKAGTLECVIQRVDELTEFLAIYWKDGRCPISAQAKLGLANAFCKFDAYQLAKYNRDKAVKLKDVMFLSHPKPKDDEQAAVWKALVDDTLQPPDTWEVALSGGADKRATWERLMLEKKLGGMALIRNLRNMEKVGVDRELICESINTMNVKKLFPYRFLAAAIAAPSFEKELEAAMFRAASFIDKLPGLTVVVVDSSGSMTNMMSSRSEMRYIDAASSIAAVCREICESVRVFSYGTRTVEVPARRGFALRDAILHANTGWWTKLGECIYTINMKVPNYDRVIVFTDEQTADRIDPPLPSTKGYVVNVASYQNGVGYGNWTHIDGFSSSILRYVQEIEKGL